MMPRKINLSLKSTPVDQKWKVVIKLLSSTEGNVKIEVVVAAENKESALHEGAAWVRRLEGSPGLGTCDNITVTATKIR